GRKVGQRRQARQHALRDSEHHHQYADHRVEDRLDEERRRDRRIPRALDAVLREVDLYDVAAADRDDAVDSDAGDVGAEDPAEPEALVWIGGAERVEPAPRTAADVAEVEAERKHERAPLDVGEAAEERPGGVPERVGARPDRAQELPGRRVDEHRPKLT